MDPAFLITTYIVFVYSTVCHEAAHAWVAHKLGDSTAYHGGQVTLDPIPHIRREPFGMVLVPLLCLFLGKGVIGWASAPLDAHWAAQNPKRSAVVALAGPAANLLLLVAAGVLMFIGAKNGMFLESSKLSSATFILGRPGTAWEVVAQVLSVIFTLNLLLFILNLLPVPPLDGSNIPLLFLKQEAAESYQQFIHQPWISLLTFIALFRIFPVIYVPVLLKVWDWTSVWFFGS